MRAHALTFAAALGLAAALGGCNAPGYSDCGQGPCGKLVYHDSYPAFADGRPAIGEPPYEEPFADYTRRSLTISPGAGNAQAANTALQTSSPWPRYSNNTNIPGNGAQMVKAVRQFECGKRPALAEPSGGAAIGIQINNTSGGGGGGEGQQDNHCGEVK